MAIRIILWRDRLRGNWMVTYRGPVQSEDVSNITPYSTAEKAGDVARLIQKANPGSEVGIKSEEFGDATTRLFGPIVWLRGQVLDHGMQ